jgi:hypothetical protein
MSLDEVENISMYLTLDFNEVALFAKEKEKDDQPIKNISGILSVFTLNNNWNDIYSFYANFASIMLDLKALVLSQGSFLQNSLPALRILFSIKYPNFAKILESNYNDRETFRSFCLFDYGVYPNIYYLRASMVSLCYEIYNNLPLLKYILPKRDEIEPFSNFNTILTSTLDYIECFKILDHCINPLLRRLNEEIVIYIQSSSELQLHKVIAYLVFADETFYYPELNMERITRNYKRNSKYFEALVTMQVLGVADVDSERYEYIKNSFKLLRVIIESMIEESSIYRFLNLLTFETDTDIRGEVNFRLKHGHNIDDTKRKLIDAIPKYCAVYEIPAVDGEFTHAFICGTRLVFINEYYLKDYSRVKAESVLLFTLLHELCHVYRACIVSRNRLKDYTPSMKYYEHRESGQCFEVYIGVSI